MNYDGRGDLAPTVFEMDVLSGVLNDLSEVLNKQGDEVPPTALLAWLVQIDLSLKHLVIAHGTF